SDLTSARLPSLRTLHIANNVIKDRGLLALTQAGLPALEELDATSCELTRAGVIGFAAGPLAPRLTSLALPWNSHVTTDGCLALARAPLDRLQRLDLSNLAVTDEVAESLAANASLTGLRTLQLRVAALSDRGVRAIVDSPNLSNLKQLRLSRRSLDSD